MIFNEFKVIRKRNKETILMNLAKEKKAKRKISERGQNCFVVGG
jgi:hypothetical protein